MGNSTTHRLALITTMAVVVTLSACAAPSAESAVETTADTNQSATPAAEASAAPAVSPRPTPVQYRKVEAENLESTESVPSKEQMWIAQSWAEQMSTNAYTLSGQYANDGLGYAGAAKLWANYFSDDLLAKLTDVGAEGDVSGFANIVTMAMPPLDVADTSSPFQASASCRPTASTCLFLRKVGGTVSSAGGIKSDTVDLSIPNRVAFDYDIAIPISLPDKGHAEGVMSGLLKVEVTFVKNPTPGDGRPAYLIDTVNNSIPDNGFELLSDHPDLIFGGS